MRTPCSCSRSLPACCRRLADSRADHLRADSQPDGPSVGTTDGQSDGMHGPVKAIQRPRNGWNCAGVPDARAHGAADRPAIGGADRLGIADGGADGGADDGAERPPHARADAAAHAGPINPC